VSPEEVYTIINKNGNGSGSLIAVLEDIQARFGYLPKEALEIVARQTNRRLVDVYGVATFYRAFSLEPRGRHLISVCLGTACHVRGGPLIAEEFERQLGVRAGATTKDKQFTLTTVNCLGACALGPVAVVDGHYFSHMTTTRVAEVLSLAAEGLDKISVTTDQRVFPVDVACSHCNHTFMDAAYLIDGHPSIRVTVSYNRTHGWLRLSSLYGSRNVESEHSLPEESVVDFFCPHCHSELIGAAVCPECNGKMVPMIVKGGGVVQICPRRGCKGHMLDLT